MDSSLGIIAVVLGSIALLLFLILKLKLHEVLALLLVSVIAGLAFGMSPAFVFETIEKGMGKHSGLSGRSDRRRLHVRRSDENFRRCSESGGYPVPEGG